MATARRPIVDEEHCPGLSELAELSTLAGMMTEEVYDALSEDERQRLSNLLPGAAAERRCGIRLSESVRAANQKRTLKLLFEGDNFFFGSPLDNFHRQLNAGRFTPDTIQACLDRQHALRNQNNVIASTYHSRLFAAVIRAKRDKLGEASVSLDLSRIVNKCLMRKRKKKTPAKPSSSSKAAPSSARDDSDVD